MSTPEPGQSYLHSMAREWIYRRLDGKLSSENRLRLDQHLEGCPECSAFAAQVLRLDRRLSADLPALGAERQAHGLVVPPQAAWLGRAWQQHGQTLARRRKVGWLVLSFAALIALVAFFAWPGRRTQADMPVIPVATLDAGQIGATQTAIAVWPTATAFPTQTPQATALPRPQGVVLYEASDNSSTDMYYTRADASGRLMLAAAPSFDRAPHPSPDRSQVAFLSNRVNSGQHEIYLTDADGKNIHQVTDMGAESPGWTGEMDWSPDGQNLVAVLKSKDGADTFRVVRGDRVDESRQYDGNWEGRLYTINLTTGTTLPLTPAEMLTWNPTWSPTGARIYFNTLVEGYSRLMSVRPDGSDMRPVGLVDGGFEQAGFTFSPDGSQLVYMALRRSRGNARDDEIQMVNLASGRTTTLWRIANTGDIDLSLAARFANLRWSPDGQHLAYAIPGSDGQAVLKMLDLEPDANLPGIIHTTYETVLYVGIDLYFPGHVPAWSFDSRGLAFLLGRRVFVMSAYSDADNIGGADLIEIYTGRYDLVGASWLSWFP